MHDVYSLEGLHDVAANSNDIPLYVYNNIEYVFLVVSLSTYVLLKKSINV